MEPTQLDPVDMIVSVFVVHINYVIWAQVRRFHRNAVYSIKGRTVDKVQNYDSYINMPSSHLQNQWQYLCIEITKVL
jgi:hypothetical protein